MSLLTGGPLPVTAPLVLNGLMARMVEAAGFGAAYFDGGARGYEKVVLEADLNVTEMCHGKAGADLLLLSMAVEQGKD